MSVGGGRSRDRTPHNTHTLRPPIGAQRPLPPFSLGPHHPRQPPTSRVSPTTTAARSSADTPPLLPCPKPAPGASQALRRLPGIQWSGGKTRPNVPLGEGRETPPYPDRGPLPWPCSPPFGGEEGSGAQDVISRWRRRAFISPSRPSPAPPSPNPSRGCRGETGRQAGWAGMDAEGGHWVSPSPPPLNNERS